MKLILVAGARPNFMKVGSLVNAIESHNQAGKRRIEYLLVHTGQHYDKKMSQTFFKDLGLPKPAVDLGVGSASHAVQTAEIMKGFEPVLLKERPDAVVVVGDVNSTTACSVVSAKITYDAPTDCGRWRPLLAHVEAGLRSFDRDMPEEINRMVTDVLADCLFVTEVSAVRNLRREGVPMQRIFFVGNTMVDTLLKHLQRVEESTVLQRLGLRATGYSVCWPYGLVTLHRPSNVDDPKTFSEIFDALSTISEELALIFPVHPRTVNRMEKFGFGAQYRLLDDSTRMVEKNRGIFCIEPQGYLDFLSLMSNAKLVLTDSGGIQEETTALRVPCVTLRKNTERPVTIQHGTNVLAGTRKEDIIRMALRQLKKKAFAAEGPRFWDGRASQRIIRILSQKISPQGRMETGGNRSVNRCL